MFSSKRANRIENRLKSAQNVEPKMTELNSSSKNNPTKTETFKFHFHWWSSAHACLGLNVIFMSLQWASKPKERFTGIKRYYWRYESLGDLAGDARAPYKPFWKIGRLRKSYWKGLYHVYEIFKRSGKKRSPVWIWIVLHKVVSCATLAPTFKLERILLGIGQRDSELVDSKAGIMISLVLNCRSSMKWYQF